MTRLDPVLRTIDTILAARDWTAAAVFGHRCRYGCGQRVYPKDAALHEVTDHAGDTP